jgi:hypothetical protein
MDFFAAIYLYFFTVINVLDLIFRIGNFFYVKTDVSQHRRLLLLRIVRDLYYLAVLFILLALFNYQYIDGWTVILVSAICFLPFAIFVLWKKEKRTAPATDTEIK